MIAAFLELLTLVVWELFLAFVLYTTGAVLLRLFSLGKIKPLLWLPKKFKAHKGEIEYLATCYLLGALFYVVLIMLTIGRIN